MRTRWIRRTLLLTLLALVGTVGAGPATATPENSSGPVKVAVPRYVPCETPIPGRVRCLSHVRRTATIENGRPSTAAATIPGLKAADIRAAYHLPKSGAKNQTIAIVDAFDNPNVEKDLAVYRRANGLGACTTANKCFRKIDQRGGTTYPEGDPGWGIEIALDVQAVSAACPSCRILLVEADDPSFEALGTAVNTAVRLGATVISNSYGADESSDALTLNKKYFTHPGVTLLASSGDYGFTAASVPAVLPGVWAIGGTLLNRTKAGGYTEKAWANAGSACSAYIRKPAVQKDNHCAMRTVSDVSAAADSAQGFAVYDTYLPDDQDLGVTPVDHWLSVSGTSLSSPLIAGMIGLAGNGAKVAKPSYPYTHRSGLKDVTGGSNGFCGHDYLCTGVKGYDGPTGLGSPRGLKSL